MPRDANGVYSLPPAYLAVTGNTITALQHNSPLEDLASAITASLPRNGAAPMQGTLRINTDSPTLALQDTDGRSGFITANASVLSIQRGAVNGTIWDAGPNGRAPMTVNLENGSVTFSGSWVSYGPSTSNGNIEIKASWPSLILQKAAAAESNVIAGRAPNGNQRWGASFGNSVAEAGANVGSDFSVDRYNDGGVWIDAPLYITRSTGRVSLTARPLWAGFTPWDSNNFDPTTKVSKAGDTMTGNLTIQNTAPFIALADTDQSTRYIQNNGGFIGFLGPDANWRARVDDAGAIWTLQFGDLSTRIEDRAAAHAATAASNRVLKAGDTMTGNLTLSKASPVLYLVDTGTGAQRGLFHDSSLIGLIGSDSNWKLRVDDAGAVWTAQFGDLSTRIESRASSYAAARVAKTGDTMTGNLTFSKDWPTISYFWAGTKHTQVLVNSAGSYVIQDGDSATVHAAISSSGAIYTQQFGDLSARIEARADSWSASRREEAKAWSYANLVGGVRLAGGGDVSAAVNAWAGAGNGDVVTGVHWSSINSQIVDVVRIRSLQAQFNGTWFTVSTS